MKYILKLGIECKKIKKNDVIDKVGEMFSLRPFGEEVQPDGLQGSYYWVDAYVDEDPRPNLDILADEFRSVAEFSYSVEEVRVIVEYNNGEKRTKFA